MKQAMKFIWPSERASAAATQASSAKLEELHATARQPSTHDKRVLLIEDFNGGSATYPIIGKTTISHSFWLKQISAIKYNRVI